MCRSSPWLQQIQAQVIPEYSCRTSKVDSGATGPLEGRVLRNETHSNNNNTIPYYVMY